MDKGGSVHLNSGEKWLAEPLSNAMRAQLAKSGIAASVGRNGIKQMLYVIANAADEGLLADARFCQKVVTS